MKKGFTLIELSIVLVIVGLIIGGVLVGRDLISAAGVRAQISQIEKYQSAVNTFRGKYGYLPGDIPDPTAQQYGFLARVAGVGGGDGNGMIECIGFVPGALGLSKGETVVFWMDLSNARLIDGGFSLGSFTAYPPLTTGGGVNKYFPSAKLGAGNDVYVWSGGWTNGIDLTGSATSDEKNYFTVASVQGMNASILGTNDGLTVSQAYNIDNKIDDGLPQFGRVTALLTIYNFGPVWAGGAYTYPPDYLGVSGNYTAAHDPTTHGPVTAASAVATPSNPLSCYDNNNTAGAIERYSISTNNGTGINCALSFQFQ